MSTCGRAGYRGRFAPSPTGPLHFGSLVAAVGSFLQARHQGGEWLVRIDDVDTVRSRPGAAEAILGTLDRLGMHWDGPVVLQSERRAEYRAALERLSALGLAYPCGCTRKELAGGVYPGTCRRGIPPGKRPRSVRMITAYEPTRMLDGIQGEYSQTLARDVGDFVLKRSDGLFAYHLATVIDDAAQGVTEVVRGSDLLSSTPRQIHLQRALGLPTPGYLHLPIAVNAQGQKLSKQSHAPPIDPDRPKPAIWQSLRFLGQRPPAPLLDESIEHIWAWATSNWRLDLVPRTEKLTFTD